MAGERFISIESFPPLLTVVKHFNEFAFSLKSFREPLKRSIQQVLAPSMKRRFEIGGPDWEPLDENTLTHQARSGGGILVDTGRLKRAASSLNSWSIDGPGGEARMTNVPEYGWFHNEGTAGMPQREWALITDEDADKIEQVFVDWVAERLARV